MLENINLAILAYLDDMYMFGKTLGEAQIMLDVHVWQDIGRNPNHA